MASTLDDRGQKDPWGPVDTVARCIRHADQAEQSLILHRSIRERFVQPGIEPAARHVEKAAHHGRIKLSAIGVDERVFQRRRRPGFKTSTFTA